MTMMILTLIVGKNTFLPALCSRYFMDKCTYNFYCSGNSNGHVLLSEVMFLILRSQLVYSVNVSLMLAECGT